MDLATIIGLVLAWGALIGAVLLEGGDPRALINIPAALLVFGGTLGAATISFRLNQMMGIPDILRKAFSAKEEDIPGTIALLVGYAERARREGLLSLQEEAANTKD